MDTPKNIRLLAIRPMDNCDKRFTRSLKPGTIYPFVQNYDFITRSNGSINKIIASRDVDDLYNRVPTGSNKIDIQISAVVGENGSGKSSLVEMLYLGIYLMAINQKLLVFDVRDRSYRRNLDEYIKIKELFKAEIYFEIDHKFVCLHFNSTRHENPLEDVTNIETYRILQGDLVAFEDLFYSIAINYSLYGLNERSSGFWLGSLFHKNDGYRTPLVINPFRNWGNIDIFSEAHLAQSRLLANLKPGRTGLVGVLSDRSINSVKLRRNVQKVRMLDKIPMHEVIKQMEKNTETTQDALFSKIYRQILQVENLPDMHRRYGYRMIIQTYVLKKIVKIAKNYPEYREHFFDDSNSDRIPSVRYFDDFIVALSLDLSHVTLKLRQALNTFRFDMLRVDSSEGVVRNGEDLLIPIDSFSKRIQYAHSQFPHRELVEFIPNAILMPTIIMDDGSNFINLSSGEQQFIHSMQSIIYHLNNLNSAFQTLAGPQRLTFSHVNIILDEIELYFHPEFQRRYIQELLVLIRSMEITNICAINIIFLTHSPFILSDIPKSNILKLKGGRPITQMGNTFAGNIHTMLSDSFFMRSTMGEFARGQCREIIEFYDLIREAKNEELPQYRTTYLSNRKHFYFLLENIGEDVLSGALENHLDYLDERLNVLNHNKDTDIENLLKLRKKIDQDLKKRGYDQN